MRKISQECWLIIFVIVSQLTGFIYMVNYPRRLTLAVLALSFMAAVFSAWIAKKYGAVYGACFAICVIAFLIRADYIIYTPTWLRQHDVIGFGAGEGQAGFIEYFYEKIRLIDFDPRKKWGFFQPPLHHMLAGLWLRLQVLIGKPFAFSYDHACENVQILTMIYSGVTVYFAGKIYRILNIAEKPLVFALTLVAFHPSFIFMSGSINNDILCICLQTVCIYFFLKWCKNESCVNISLAALFMGLSMMAKLQAVLLAPAIAVVLLFRLVAKIKNKEKLSELIKQYALFGLISIPLGIWSPVRNLVRFGVPLNFTPKVNEPVGEMSIWERVFKWGAEVTPFTCLKANGNSYDEFNIPLTLLKTSLFGESDFSGVSGAAVIAGWALLISGILFAVMCAALMVWSIRGLKANKENSENIVFWNVYIIVSFIFIINLCISIPNFSSQDFRYIAHVIVAFGALLGMYLKDGRSRALKQLAMAVTALFALGSYVMYLLAGMVIWN